MGYPCIQPFSFSSVWLGGTGVPDEAKDLIARLLKLEERPDGRYPAIYALRRECATLFSHRRRGRRGRGQLTLDIDYILEWISPTDKDGRFSFVVWPADLVFHEVTDLVISIDYASCSALLQPMMIGETQREVFTYPNGYSSFSWKIELNGPEDSFISFHSPRMLQVLKGEAVRSTSQWLMPSQRTM